MKREIMVGESRKKTKEKKEKHVNNSTHSGLLQSATNILKFQANLAPDRGKVDAPPFIQTSRENLHLFWIPFPGPLTFFCFTNSLTRSPFLPLFRAHMLTRYFPNERYGKDSRDFTISFLHSAIFRGIRTGLSHNPGIIAIFGFLLFPFSAHPYFCSFRVL